MFSWLNFELYDNAILMVQLRDTSVWHYILFSFDCGCL